MNRRLSRRPQGFVLLIVMGLLAVATLLVAGGARILLLENRQAQQAEDRQQAQWLAESALQRAGARLVANRHYQGETWQLTAADLGQPTSSQGAIGVAVIKVEAVADRPAARRVSVAANFPLATDVNPTTHRVSRQIVLELSAGEAQPAETAKPAEESSLQAQKSASTVAVENQP